MSKNKGVRFRTDCPGTTVGSSGAGMDGFVQGRGWVKKRQAVGENVVEFPS